MPNTTPTAASAHLVTHNHGRSVDTHLHEPAPARGPRDLPVPTMGCDDDAIELTGPWLTALVAFALIGAFVFGSLLWLAGRWISVFLTN